MSRKNRHIAGFQDVANISNINNEKDNIDINNSNNMIDSKNSSENDNDIDIFEQIIHDSKGTDKIFRGVYFDREVANAIDRIARKAGGKKGIKSQIVNEAVKKVFKEKGWL